MGDDRCVRLHGAELLPRRRMRLRIFGVQNDRERNVEILEQAGDAQIAPGQRILAEIFVHQIRRAASEIGAVNRSLAKAEFLDEQREAHRDFLAAGPGGDVDVGAWKLGDRVDAVLGKNRRGQKQRNRRRRSDQACWPKRWAHCDRSFLFRT